MDRTQISGVLWQEMGEGANFKRHLEFGRMLELFLIASFIDVKLLFCQKQLNFAV